MYNTVFIYADMGAVLIDILVRRLEKKARDLTLRRTADICIQKKSCHDFISRMNLT